MGEMEPDINARPPLHMIFDGARRFGLTDGEVLLALDESLCRVDTDATVAELLEELTGTLAQSILSKSQRTLAEEQRAPSTEGRAASQEAF
jgi:hypothetical protein